MLTEDLEIKTEQSGDTTYVYLFYKGERVGGGPAQCAQEYESLKQLAIKNIKERGL